MKELVEILKHKINHQHKLFLTVKFFEVSLVCSPRISSTEFSMVWPLVPRPYPAYSSVEPGKVNSNMVSRGQKLFSRPYPTSFPRTCTTAIPKSLSQKKHFLAISVTLLGPSWSSSSLRYYT